ncbi:MAG: bifunctional glutamate N-acetyltransferase/amino-acid acetyltransferase ArgJ [Spirochaetales bacterium]
MRFIEGGVCAPTGFTAHAVYSGIKNGKSDAGVLVDGVKNVRGDTALIFSDVDCVSAGVFTKNRVQAEPVKLCKTKLQCAEQPIRAIIVNSGNANACTGEQGMLNAQKMCSFVAKAADIHEQNVLVCSTGVIGKQLPLDVIEEAVPTLVKGLSKNGNILAREAIMTTDTRYKECAAETQIGGKPVRFGTMAKGSGMIHINMGTMLGFITTDCAISADMLQRAVRESAETTYNCVSVDGDTSTNDTVLILANGTAKNTPITTPGEDYNAFLTALNEINTKMARAIAADGEGAEHLIECIVNGAVDIKSARALAKSVISSNLVKAAFFGKDANWGRILCALGYSGQIFSPEKTSVTFMSAAGSEKVFENGQPLDFDEKNAAVILAEDEVKIYIDLQDGTAQGIAWGCDLTYEYVKINGDYRT